MGFYGANKRARLRALSGEAGPPSSSQSPRKPSRAAKEKEEAN